MTFEQYVSTMNDPRRRMGPWGPLDRAAAYRIDGDRRPAAARPAQQRGTHEDLARFRLEQHAKAAKADKVVARLRRLR